MSLIKNALQITDLGCNPEDRYKTWTDGLDCLHLTHMFIVCNFLSSNNIASKKKIRSDGLVFTYVFTAVKNTLYL